MDSARARSHAPGGDDGGRLRSGAATSSRMISIRGSASQDPGDIGGELPSGPPPGPCPPAPVVAVAAAMIRESSRRISSLSKPRRSRGCRPLESCCTPAPQERRLVGRRKFLGLHLRETDPDPRRAAARPLTSPPAPADNGEAPVLVLVFGFRWP